MHSEKAFAHWTLILSVVCSLVITPVPFVDVVGSVPAAVAQCDPPGPNIKCWDNDLGNGLWSKDDNWNPDERPLPGDDVYHLIGGTIDLDIGTPMAPVVVNSFSFDTGALGGLTMEFTTALTVATDFGDPLVPTSLCREKHWRTSRQWHPASTGNRPSPTQRTTCSGHEALAIPVPHL